MFSYVNRRMHDIKNGPQTLPIIITKYDAYNLKQNVNAFKKILIDKLMF